MYKLQQIVIVGLLLMVYWLSHLTGKTLLRIIIKYFHKSFCKDGSRMGMGLQASCVLHGGIRPV